jgi:hypothetical protein
VYPPNPSKPPPVIGNESKGNNMAMIVCKECKSNISDKAVKCPSCGAEYPSLSGSLFKAGCALMAMPFLLLIVGLCFGLLYIIFRMAFG